MVQLETKVTESGVMYVPKEIREAFTRHMKIIPNARAAVFFPAKASYEDVLVSLEIIVADIKHRISMRERAKAETSGERS